MKQRVPAVQIPVALLAVLAGPASATLITFDDVAPYHWLIPESEMSLGEAIEYGYAGATPLTDQYAHLGLSFGEGEPDHIVYEQSSDSGAAISTFDEVVVSGPNAVSSQYYHDGLHFWFVGDDRPEYLSFYTSAPNGGAMSIYVYETGGTTQELRLGWHIVDGEFAYTERPMKQKVEFFSDGIEEVWISNFTNHRTTPVYMDDLYFAAGQAVPEPTSFSLLLSGAFGLGLVAWRRRHRGTSAPC